MRLEWGARPYLADGISQGVLYSGEVGVAWEGLISIVEKPAEIYNVDYYYDGLRVRITQARESYASTVTAFTYPPEFEKHSGYLAEVTTRRFGMSYRTDQHIHLIYNALAHVSDRSYSTRLQTTSATNFVWEILASDVPVPGAQSAAHLIVDTVGMNPEVLAEMENWLYGTDTTDPYLPPPEDLVELIEITTQLQITYMGGGLWSAIGPDAMVHLGDEDGAFTIVSPSAVLLGDGKFIVSST